MLTAALPVSWNDGAVTIEGNDGPNTIIVRQVGDRYVFSGSVFSHSELPVSYGVREFRVSGFGGNDVIYNDTDIPMLIHGGEGHDELTGGAGVDQIWGGPGDDTIRGRGANDELYGEDGNDNLWSDEIESTVASFLAHARPGSDSLHGGPGESDRLDGSQAIDDMAWNDGVLYLTGTAKKDDLIVRQTGEFLHVDGISRAWMMPEVIEIAAGAGDDVVYNDAGVRMIVDGGVGRDELTGGPLDDVFYTDSESLVRGRDGNDVLVVNGTTGNDRIFFRNAGNGNVEVESGGRQWAAETVEYLRAFGHRGDDVLYNDTHIPSELNGGDGLDVLTGGGGNDTLFADSDELARGRGGDDTLVVIGTNGDDRIFFRPSGGDLEVESAGRRWNATGFEAIAAYGKDGNDLLYNDSYVASSLYGGHGDDELVGGGSQDVLAGGHGNDTLHGRGGDDSLHGQAGNDILFGSDGDDLLTGGGGDDHLNGGQGNDTVSYEYSGQGVHVDLRSHSATGQGSDTVEGVENIIGSRYDDRLFGNDEQNVIAALDGSDTVEGFGGTDVIFGGRGNDWISGGRGADLLFGENGDDTLFGLDGSDFLDGGTGTDDLDGGSDNDEEINGENGGLFGKLFRVYTLGWLGSRVVSAGTWVASAGVTATVEGTKVVIGSGVAAGTVTLAGAIVAAMGRGLGGVPGGFGPGIEDMDGPPIVIPGGGAAAAEGDLDDEIATAPGAGLGKN